MRVESDAGKQAPLSLAVLFAPLFLAVTALHLTLLRLPYFWDEGGYYIPAAWDFFRLGTVIPVTTMRNAHPPLPSVLLAGWWKVFGFHILSTRLLMCVVTTFALLGVFRLARMFAGQSAAFAVMVLTAIYPVWFAQTTLAHADMFAAAFSLWGLCFYSDRVGWVVGVPCRSARANAAWVSVLFSLACLAKETAVVLPAALFLLECWGIKRAGGDSAVPRLRGDSFVSRLKVQTRRIPGFRYAVALMLPAVVLGCWYIYHWHATGFMFGNPEYLRYNATANMSVRRVLLSMRHRTVHLSIHMNLFVPVLSAMIVALFPARRAVLRRPAARLIAVLIVAQWLAFSVLGGALLTRYVLPAYPLLLIICVAAWKSRFPRWWWVFALGSLGGFVVACTHNPPYPFAPEDNLAYRDMIVVHEDAVRFVTGRYPYATVLTAWPVLADLQRPELGYLQTPVKTAAVENFSIEEMRKAAARPETYDVAIVFSTKYDPPPGGLNLAGVSRRNDARFYDWHSDLLPGEAARVLHGRVVWQEDRNGEWAAVLVFPRGKDAFGFRPELQPVSSRFDQGSEGPCCHETNFFRLIALVRDAHVSHARRGAPGSEAERDWRLWRGGVRRDAFALLRMTHQ